MATAPALLSIEDYLHTSYGPDVDFVDDHIEERNVGERDHGQVQWLIAEMLGRERKRLGLLGMMEQRIRVNASRVRICDVVLIRESDPYERVATIPPLVCIEVLSPVDRLSRAALVFSDYYEMGVRNLWLIDPMRHCAYTYNGEKLLMTLNGKLQVAETEISLDLDQLFSEMNTQGTE